MVSNAVCILQKLVLDDASSGLLVHGEMVTLECFGGFRDLARIGSVRDLAVLLVHVLATVARLDGPGGVRVGLEFACQAATGSWTTSLQWETQRIWVRSTGVTVFLSANVSGVRPSKAPWLRAAL